MRTIKYIMLGLFFMLFVGAHTVYAQKQYKDSGAFSAYLVGTYENGRGGVFTGLQIINPTTEQELAVVVAFYDDNGVYKTCKKFTLSPNDIEEIVVSFHVTGIPTHGVVKIISYEGNEPKRGIVGFQRHILLNKDLTFRTWSKSVLTSVPMEVAEKELPEILKLCP